MWPRFSIPLAFEALWFWSRATYRGDYNDWSSMWLWNFTHNSRNFHRSKNAKFNPNLDSVVTHFRNEERYLKSKTKSRSADDGFVEFIMLKLYVFVCIAEINILLADHLESATIRTRQQEGGSELHRHQVLDCPYGHDCQWWSPQASAVTDPSPINQLFQSYQQTTSEDIARNDEKWGKVLVETTQFCHFPIWVYYNENISSETGATGSPERELMRR